MVDYDFDIEAIRVKAIKEAVQVEEDRKLMKVLSEENEEERIMSKSW